METTVITDLGNRFAKDRRYRRAGDVPKSLAFQCAHVQESLGLDVIVLSDETGESWVGSGDKGLCRLLARSASAIGGDDLQEREFRLSALRSLRSDLGHAQLTTFRIDVPNSSRSLYVTGVGRSKMRDHGVIAVSDGSRRILGLPRRRRGGDHAVGVQSTEELLQALIRDAWSQQMVLRDEARPDAPRRLFGMTDDRAYVEVLDQMLHPVAQTLQQSGVLLSDAWENWRLRSRERHVDGDVYRRDFRISLTEARSGALLGTLGVGLVHAHRVWDLPSAPLLTLRWVHG